MIKVVHNVALVAIEIVAGVIGQGLTNLATKLTIFNMNLGVVSGYWGQRLFYLPIGFFRASSQIKWDENTMTLQNPYPLEYVMTIEKLFETIQDAYDKDAYLVAVEYDEENGSPISIYINQIEMLFDEEIGYQIRDVNLL